jgi:hypothetical protein
MLDDNAMWLLHEERLRQLREEAALRRTKPPRRARHTGSRALAALAWLGHALRARIT